MAKVKTKPAPTPGTKKPPPAAPAEDSHDGGEDETFPPPSRETLATSRLLAEQLGVEVREGLTGKEVQRLLKPLPGYANLLDDVARKLPADAAVLNLKNIDPKELLALKARHEELSQKESAARIVYFSVRQQRMQIDDEAMRLLRLINRRVATRQEEDADLYERWKSLREYLAAFSRGPGQGGDPTEGGDK